MNKTLGQILLTKYIIINLSRIKKIYKKCILKYYYH